MGLDRINFDDSGFVAIEREVDAKLVHPITDAVAADMIRYVPVLSGDLQGTIRPEHLPGEGRIHFGDVGEGIDYHLWVEFGTSKMDAQPYARPALYKVREGE